MILKKKQQFAIITYNNILKNTFTFFVEKNTFASLLVNL